MKLIQLLLSSKALTHYPKPTLLFNRKVKPRFFYVIASIIVVILFILLWDKLVPESFVTSRYMQAVFCKGEVMN